MICAQIVMTEYLLNLSCTCLHSLYCQVRVWREKRATLRIRDFLTVCLKCKAHPHGVRTVRTQTQTQYYHHSYLSFQLSSFLRHCVLIILSHSDYLSNCPTLQLSRMFVHQMSTQFLRKYLHAVKIVQAATRDFLKRTKEYMKTLEKIWDTYELQYINVSTYFCFVTTSWH